MIQPNASASVGVLGIAIWIDKNAPDAANTFNGGSTQIISGAIYLPSQSVDYSGGNATGTNRSQLIALTIAFSGSGHFNHNGSGQGVSDPPGTPILVQ